MIAGIGESGAKLSDLLFDEETSATVKEWGSGAKEVYDEVDEYLEDDGDAPDGSKKFKPKPKTQPQESNNNMLIVGALIVAYLVLK